MIAVKMDKQRIIEEDMKKEKRRFPNVKHLGLIIAAVSILAFGAFGSFYVWNQLHVDDSNTCKTPSVTKTFNADLDTTSAKLHDRVTIYEEEAQIFNVLMDPATGFIKSIKTDDFIQELIISYDAASGNCYLVEMEDCCRNFWRAVEILEGNANGPNSVAEAEYEIAGPLNETAILGLTMTPYCSSDNSYWVHKTNEGNRQKRQDRGTVVIVVVVVII